MARAVADTSFLFSLYGRDSHTPAAQGWLQQSQVPIVVTALNRYELANALRLAEFRHLIRTAQVSASLTAFESDLKNGGLQLTPCDFSAVVAEADRLSARYTPAGGHRAFDILHVAAAKVLRATTFLTFDLNQRKLATAVHLPVAP